MSATSCLLSRAGTILALCGVFLGAGCVHQTGQSQANSRWNPQQPATDAATLAEIYSLQKSLCALAPTVRWEEAEETARCAVEYSQQLAEEYRVVRPAFFHNFLVNVRMKQRGLCFEWTEDLLAQLDLLQLGTLSLNWAVARGGSAREHNSVVITARGDPFERGLVLDAWRRGGRLTWVPVALDKYPWEEGVWKRTPSAP